MQDKRRHQANAAGKNFDLHLAIFGIVEVVDIMGLEEVWAIQVAMVKLKFVLKRVGYHFDTHIKYYNILKKRLKAQTLFRSSFALLLQRGADLLASLFSHLWILDRKYV